MKIVLKFFDVCLFKAGPADIPYSPLLLQLTLMTYFLVGIAIGLVDSSLMVSVVSSFTDMTMLIFVVWILLRIRKHEPRYQQTLTAMAGAGSCLGLIGLPIVLLFKQTDQSQQTVSIAVVLMMGLLFWSLIVTAQIFRLALEIKPSTATLLTIFYTVISIIGVSLATSGTI